jgi:putative tRNA adenosine deaminase-associated protein
MTWATAPEATTVAIMAASGNDSDGDLDGFAIAVVREETAWKVTALKPSALTDLADAERQLRDLRAAGAVFGLLDVDDEFFVVLRPAPGGARLLLSDATAALDYDDAADALEALNIDAPDLDPDDLDDVDPWEEGDLAVLADLGLPDAVMSVIVSDTDLYADEQVGMIAARLGFADELAKVLDSLGH